MNLELMGALSELESERGISKEVLLEAIEAAIVSAYKRNYGGNAGLSVRLSFNEKNGEIRVYSRQEVVEDEPDDSNTQISLADAQAVDPSYEVGDIVELEITPRNFGRIAAQTAKQVVIQRIREAERAIVYDEFANREGDVITGVVQRQENRSVIVDLGKVEAIVQPGEQIPGERYHHNARMKFLIHEVKQSTKGPQVFLSRTHPGLLRNLFELEVPEIQSGEVEIKAVAREAGHRSKVAVYSPTRDIDPVGACVGARGSRIQAVVSELNSEKIDVIRWTAEDEEYIANALSPAKTVRVVLDAQTRTARTVVPDDQLSLAIGKEGQNARLAARLTGWKVDIKSESQAKEIPDFLLPPEPALPEAEEPQPLDRPEVEESEKALEPAEPSPIPADSSEIAADAAQTADDGVEDTTEAQEEPTEAPGMEELAKLSNVRRRKSWEERFGSQPEAEGSRQEKQKDDSAQGRKKQKEKEKVLKDLSQLSPEDFGFGGKE